jgi:glycerol-3-phosphate dehydrogenase
VVASAHELGAALELPGELLAATRAGDGWSVRYATGAGEERETTARVLVNAAGPWVNRVAARVSPGPPRRTIDLVGGSHIELEGVLERGIYYTEAADRRAVFSVPWKGRTMVGTTERELPPEDREPHPDMHRLAPTDEEVEYLRATFARHFPGRSTEVLAAWAGLRVLPHGSGDAFDRPRDVTLVSDASEREGGAPSYLAIYGGKLTGYRATAEKVLRALRRTLPARERRADTATLRLPADPGAPGTPDAGGTPPAPPRPADR